MRVLEALWLGRAFVGASLEEGLVEAFIFPFVWDR